MRRLTSTTSVLFQVDRVVPWMQQLSMCIGFPICWLHLVPWKRNDITSLTRPSGPMNVGQVLYSSNNLSVYSESLKKYDKSGLKKMIVCSCRSDKHVCLWSGLPSAAFGQHNEHISLWPCVLFMPLCSFWIDAYLIPTNPANKNLLPVANELEEIPVTTLPLERFNIAQSQITSKKT